VNAAGDVKEKLQKKSAAATKYYGWMVKTLGDIKKVMPESYKGALSNGTQLNHVVTELIKRAVQDSKNGDKHAIEAAKTAMEVISVSKYGLFTSKVMDALNAELKNFTFMSDPSLSWNSNPYTKAVSTAFDKGVSFLMRTIGYGATGLINAINRRNSRFDGERGDLSGLSAEWEKDNADGKKKYTDDIKKLNDEASDSITRLEGEIAATGVNDVDKTKKELAAGQKKEENIEIVLSRLRLKLEQLERKVVVKDEEIQQKIKGYSDAQQDFNDADGIYNDKIQQKNHYDSVIAEYKNLPNTIKDKQSDIVAKRGYKKYLESKLETLKYPYKNAKEENEARQLQESLKRVDTEIEAYTKSLAELMEKYKNKDKPDSELQQANKGLKGIGEEIDTAKKNRKEADDALKIAEDKKTAAESELQKLTEEIEKIKERMEKISGQQSKQKTKNRETESKIKTFQDAKKQIEELNRQIAEQQKTANEWDDKHKNLYDELIAYWDMLETGRNGRRGAFYNRWTLSKKKAQGDLDANKKAMFEEFLKNYSYTS
jgi:peptidoglycan hydrolase CwlO-like protein